MPRQQRRRGDQPMGAQDCGQPPGQRRENGTFGPIRLRAPELTTKPYLYRVEMEPLWL